MFRLSTWLHLLVKLDEPGLFWLEGLQCLLDLLVVKREGKRCCWYLLIGVVLRNLAHNLAHFNESLLVSDIFADEHPPYTVSLLWGEDAGQNHALPVILLQFVELSLDICLWPDLFSKLGRFERSKICKIVWKKFTRPKPNMQMTLWNEYER